MTIKKQTAAQLALSTFGPNICKLVYASKLAGLSPEEAYDFNFEGSAKFTPVAEKIKIAENLAKVGQSLAKSSKVRPQDTDKITEGLPYLVELREIRSVPSKPIQTHFATCQEALEQHRKLRDQACNLAAFADTHTEIEIYSYRTAEVVKLSTFKSTHNS